MSLDQRKQAGRTTARTTAHLRLLARILSALVLIATAVMLVGIVIAFRTLSQEPWGTGGLALVGLTGGIMLGLIVAWRREILGGLISLVSIAAIAVYLGVGLMTEVTPTTPAIPEGITNTPDTGWVWYFLEPVLKFAFLAAPGVLFLVTGLRSRRESVVKS